MLAITSRLRTLVLLTLLAVLLAACGQSAADNGSGAANTNGNANADAAADSAAGTSLAPSAAGEAASPAAPEPVTIRFYSYNLGTPGQKEGTQKLIDEFMALNPHITVEGVAVASTDINAKVQADIVAGTAPDVAQLVFDGLDFAVHNFNAKPLEEIASPEDLQAHFAGMSENGVKLGQLNGRTYGLAFTFSTPILFYNAKIFAEAGLDPEQPPTTWEQVKQYALQIADKTDYTGVHIGGSVGNDWIVQALIGSNGGRVLSEDRKTLHFGDPEAIGAVAMWQDMVQSGAGSPINDSEAMEAMNQGQLGMLLFTSALQNAFLASAASGGWELKAAQMPSFGAKITTPVNSGSALFVLSEDEAKQQAAWEFLKFVTGERGYTIITSEIGYLPLRPAIVDDPQYLQDWVAEHPLVRPNLEQLERLQPWVSYPGPNWRQIETILLEGVQKAIQGKGDAAAIMQDAQSRAQALMP